MGVSRREGGGAECPVSAAARQQQQRRVVLPPGHHRARPPTSGRTGSVSEAAASARAQRYWAHVQVLLWSWYHTFGPDVLLRPEKSIRSLRILLSTLKITRQPYETPNMSPWGNKGLDLGTWGPSYGRTQYLSFVTDRHGVVYTLIER